MGKERELVATVKGDMIVWLLVEAKGEPVPVVVLAEKTGLDYRYLLDKVIGKLESAFDIKRHPDRPYSVSLKLPE